MEKGDFLAFLDERVREAHHMTTTEFVDAVRTGKLDVESPQVAQFAILLARTR